MLNDLHVSGISFHYLHPNCAKSIIQREYITLGKTHTIISVSTIIENKH